MEIMKKIYGIKKTGTKEKRMDKRRGGRQGGR
jgi:hypothetical protein